MVPTLKIGKVTLDENNFINAYTKDLSREVHYEDVAHLLFKPKNLSSFRDFVEGEYDRIPPLIEDYDYEGGFVVLVYSLDSRFKSDFDLVKQGKYSKTSEKFQELFPKVVKRTKDGQEDTSLQYRIFNKTEELKEWWEEKLAVHFKDDMEWWQGFDEKKETLDIEKIRELI